MDNVQYKLGTKTIGERRRVKIDAKKEAARIWDKKLGSCIELIQHAQKQHGHFLKNDIKKLKGNLFVDDSAVRLIIEYIEEDKNELEALYIRALEIKNSYKSI